MKKYLFVFIVVIILTGCSKQSIDISNDTATLNESNSQSTDFISETYVDTKEIEYTEAIESYGHEIPQSCRLTNPEIISEEKNYSIIKGDGFKFCICLYDNVGTLVLEKYTGIHCPQVHNIGNDIIDISVGVGTGIIYHGYYSISRNLISEAYDYVIASSDKFVAYIALGEGDVLLKNRMVVIRDIFDKELYYKEVWLNFDNIHIPVISASFNDDNSALEITYLSDDKIKTTEIIYLK